MNKGIVMEIKQKTLIVMTPDGRFDEVPLGRRNCQIGEEIVYAAPFSNRVSPKGLTWASGIVAAVVFCFVLFTGMNGAFADPEVVAYVSMDINPSLELGIDAKQRVRELKGLNADGTELIKNLDYKGKKLDDLANELLKRVDTQVLAKKDDADIIIASTKVKDDANLDDSQLSEHLKQVVEQHIKAALPQKAPQIEVTAFAAPVEARESAEENGLSTGKYAVYLNALEKGQDVTLQEFKDKSVHDIAKEYGGLGQFIGIGNLNKEKLRELVSEEKDGKLGKNQQGNSDGQQGSNAGKGGKASNSPRPPGKTPTPSEHPVIHPTKTPKPQDSKKKDDETPGDRSPNGNRDSGREDVGKSVSPKPDNSHKNEGDNPSDDKSDKKESGKKDERDNSRDDKQDVKQSDKKDDQQNVKKDDQQNGKKDDGQQNGQSPKTE